MTLAVAILIVAFFAVFGVTAMAAAKDEKFRPLVRQWAALRELDPALVWGVMMTESSGNPNAENPSDPSAGLMQTIPLITRHYGEVSGTNAEVLAQAKIPEVSMKAGTGFLADLKNKYGVRMPVEEWVQAYNLGETQFNNGMRNLEYGARVIRFSKQF